MKKLFIIVFFLLTPLTTFAGSATLSLSSPAPVPPAGVTVSTVSVNVGTTSVLGAVDFTISFDTHVAQLNGIHALAPEFADNLFFSTAAFATGSVRVVALNGSTTTPSGLFPLLALDLTAMATVFSTTTLNAAVATMVDTQPVVYAPITVVPGIFTIDIDHLPPRTTLFVSTPAFGSSPLYVTSQSSFSLSAVDDRITIGDGAGVGVQETDVAVDTSAFAVYGGTFSLASEGLHAVSYFSRDTLGHVEAVHISTAAVDNSPPVTSLTYGPPFFVDASSRVFVSPASAIGLQAADPLSAGVASGLAFTEFRIDAGAPEAPFQQYASPFTLAEGTHTVDARSEDNLGNREAIQTFALNVDATPPVSHLVIPSPLTGQNGDGGVLALPDGSVIVSSRNAIVIGSTDPVAGGVSSGVKDFSVAFDTGAFTSLTPTLSLAGETGIALYSPSSEGAHTLKWYSRDNVGNTEVLRSTAVTVDNTPPTQQILISPEAVINSSGSIFVTTNTRISADAHDAGAGLDHSEYRVDASSAGADFQILNGSFSLSLGAHTVEIRSLDRVGNAKTTPPFTVSVGTSPPAGGNDEGTSEGTLSDGTTIIGSTTTIVPVGGGGDKPRVLSVRLTPAPPVGAGTVTFVVQFSTPMDAGRPPHVTFAPAGAPASVTVTQTTFSGDTWTGSAAITSGMASGLATGRVRDAADPAGTAIDNTLYTFDIDLIAPPAPVNPAVSFSTTTADLQITWQPGTGKPVKTYNLYRSTSAIPSRAGMTPIQSGITATSTRDIPSPDSAKAFYAVTAVDASGNESGVSPSVSYPMPLPPVITSPADNSILGSASFTVQGLAQAGVQVALSTGTGGGEIVIGTATAGGDRHFSVPVTLARGSFLIKGITQSSVTQIQSSTAAYITVNINVLPSAPTGLSAVPGDTIVDLIWTRNLEPNVIGYRLYRDGSTTPLNADLIPATPQPAYQDLALTDGRSYSYAVTAVDDLGQESPQSASVSATPVAGTGWGGQ